MQPLVLGLLALLAYFAAQTGVLIYIARTTWKELA
jgi:hypothetical protein